MFLVIDFVCIAVNLECAEFGRQRNLHFSVDQRSLAVAVFDQIFNRNHFQVVLVNTATARER